MRTSVQQQEQVIQRRSGIPLAQPEVPAQTQRQEPRPGLTASGSGSALIPGSSRTAAPEYASGRRFVNGNQLTGVFADPLPGEMFSMTIRWTVPPDCTISFGDGEEYTAGPLGETVEHTYDEPTSDHPWVFDAQIHDALGRLRGEHRFQLPCGNSDPRNIAAVVASKYPLP